MEQSSELVHPFWSAPNMEDAQQTDIFRAKFITCERRHTERMDLGVPATIVTSRGAAIPAFSRDFSRRGMGLLVRGLLQPEDEVTVKIASDMREYTYRAVVRWCSHFHNGMCLAGMEFLSKVE